LIGTEGLPEPYTARRRPLYLIEGGTWIATGLYRRKPKPLQGISSPVPLSVRQWLTRECYPTVGTQPTAVPPFNFVAWW